ncbi:lytic polysaccharide monooxygenase auxiliary activity family 9 protein [Micromonospora sp. CPCC 206060]|uniref:lytic polysaccharide monooxygenase auxiliary activity family 9 protein n=1 Tax=Micromonospora sp. CPCC 206060 TaxID=3122406 RepID=UPI002FF385CB
MTTQQTEPQHAGGTGGEATGLIGHQRGESRHGAISSPRSRAMIYLAEWQANGLEAGKFFPATESGLNDPFAPSDQPNAVPPADGQVASAGKDFAALLDEPRTDWEKHRVVAGEAVTLSWTYHAPHKTRRWNYFLTRPDWDPAEKLTRAQFATDAVQTILYPAQPYWEHDLVPPDPTVHTVKIPGTYRGYHVLLAVWEVADTGNAFYQVIDLDVVEAAE